MKEKKSILITGITGFVGQNLKSYFKNDFSIIGVSRIIQPAEIAYNTYFEEHLNYHAIVHLAGIAHDLKNTFNELDYYETNFELTRNLYNRFLESDAEIFIYFSSVKAAADDVAEILFEDVVPNPVTLYGKSKLMAEKYILSHLPINKKVYILRPCMIHGPGNKGNLKLLYEIVAKGLPWPLGAFTNKRSFLNIENLCFVVRELLESNNIASGVYNVSDEEPLSTNELVQLMGLSQNKSARIFPISKTIITAVAKTGDFLHLPLNTERLQKLTANYVVSNGKIVTAMGKSLPVCSKEGLLRTLESFRKEK